jgi:hypothetical protein
MDKLMPLPDASGFSSGILELPGYDAIEFLGDVSPNCAAAPSTGPMIECRKFGRIVSAGGDSLLPPRKERLFASPHKTDVGLRLGLSGAAPGAQDCGRGLSGFFGSRGSLAFDVSDLSEEDMKDLKNFFALSLELASFPNFPKMIETVLRVLLIALPACSGTTRAMWIR